MYLRPDHAENSIPALHRFIQDNPLGIFITTVASEQFPLIQCSHIPWTLDSGEGNNATTCGILRGHIARMNPQVKAMIMQLEPDPNNQSLDEEVSVVFNGQAQHYITPKFYTETKPSSGKVVPTWNYTAVQGWGRARLLWNSKLEETGHFLQRQITELSRSSEMGIMGYNGVEHQKPWEVSDAPHRYIEILKKNIVGIEIRLTRLEGKFKMSQEMPVGDRNGVVAGLAGLGSELGDELASLVEERSKIEDRRKQHHDRLQ